MSEWQLIETADTSHLFATSTWVLVATDDGRVTEGYPLYTGPNEYIWIAARGNNLRGNENSRSTYLRDSPTHWMPLPAHPTTGSNDG
jgi:hypothetical protein